MTIKVAINGYGTIGKRVADAVDAQDDMEIIGVTKNAHRLDVTSLFERAIRSIAPTTLRIKLQPLDRPATPVMAGLMICSPLLTSWLIVHLEKLVLPTKRPM